MSRLVLALSNLHQSKCNVEKIEFLVKTMRMFAGDRPLQTWPRNSSKTLLPPRRPLLPFLPLPSSWAWVPLSQPSLAASTTTGTLTPPTRRPPLSDCSTSPEPLLRPPDLEKKRGRGRRWRRENLSVLYCSKTLCCSIAFLF